jgi:hypothetical protein
MSYGMTTTALSRGRFARLITTLGLAAILAALVALTIGASGASAAFTANGFTVGVSGTQAGAHPSITLSASNDPVAADLNGDDLKSLQYDLPAGTVLNPKAVPTPCPTTTFNTDGCTASTKVGSISVTYRVAGKLYTSAGDVYSITPDTDSLINFGFVVRPTGTFQKFLFASGKAIGLTTVRQGLDKDYGLSISVPTIPRTIKSTIGTTTNMTLSNVSITLSGRSGFTAYPVPSFTTAPTRCDAAVTQVSFTSYANVTAKKTASYNPTGCDKVAFQPDFKISATNPAAGQATGISATVYEPQADQDLPIQHSHVKSVTVDLAHGTTINLGVLNALTLCSETQLASDTCPAASKIGTASVAVSVLPGAMTGEIYLTSRDTIQFGYIVRGARGTKAILRGSADVVSDGYNGGGIRASFQTLPQAPWTSANLNFTSNLINNPKDQCPYATAWADISGYSGSGSLNGALYTQTGCAPETALTTTVTGTTRFRTSKFEFTANPPENATFQCSVDSAAFAACATPFTTPSLTDGPHTFAVRAGVNGNYDTTPATASFRVDATPPTITINSPAAGATLTTSSATLDFTTERGATNYCLLDNGQTALCTSPKVYDNLADGAHRITVIALDQAGNAAVLQRSFTVAVPKTPVINLTYPTSGITLPTNRLTPNFTVTSPSGAAITKVTCQFFIVYGQDDTTGELYEYEEGAPRACTSGTELRKSEEQDYRLQIDVTDANGLAGSASVRFTTGINPPYPAGIQDKDDVANLSLNERTPSFGLDMDDARWPNPQYDCALVPTGTVNPTWTSCVQPANPGTYKVTTPLTNGNWSLMRRTRSGTVTGDTSSMDFTVGDWSSTYTATTTTTQAGAHPDLDVDITPTGAGQMRSVDMTLPKGLIGSLNSFPSCSDLVKALCPANTQVGSVDVDYTIHGGLVLKRSPGYVYFTGPQASGDAAGLVIRVPGPVAPFADVIIPLRIQLINNSQQMRVFSDSIPTDVGDIHDPTVFIRYWLKDFKMHINGSTGSPFPLLTNPSSCAAGQFSNVTGGIEGPKTAVQTIAFSATGCSTLPFAPTIAQTFTSTTAGTQAGVSAEVNLPAGNSSFKTLKVNEPAAFAPNYPAFGLAADQCPATSAPTGSSTFDATNCPASAKVGTMTIDSPLLTSPLTGTVYLINKSPLPWLGVKLDGVGIAVRLVGVTSLPQVDPTCDPTTSDDGTCPSQIAITFANIPDLPVSRIRMTIDGPNRVGTGGASLSGKILTVATASDPACIPSINAITTFTPNSGTAAVGATQPISFSGCSAH